MKTDDVNKFKGNAKGAIIRWADKKIEEMIPGKAASKTFLKNGVNNLLAKNDANLNKWIDTVFLFVANEKGTIDSDVMIDTLVKIFEEMPRKEYHFGLFDAIVEGGTVEIGLPQNFLIDMLLGGMSKVRLTTEDLLDFKTLFT